MAIKKSLVKPGFFVVGAPKSGTTALYSYLQSHEQICMPKTKEPHYFADDLDDKKYRSITSKEEYLDLFRHCDSSDQVAGEISSLYLYSKPALKKIFEFNPSAKIIAMLRNPVDLAYSLHAQNLLNLVEDEKDFQKAWNLQGSRINGCNIPATCELPGVLLYKDVALLGAQVKKLYCIFPKEQVKLIFFDDFICDTATVYQDVLRFLSVSLDGRSDFPRVNESKIYKSRLFAKLTEAPPSQLRSIAIFLRRRLNINLHNILNRVRKINSTTYSRPVLSPEFRARLREEFSEDIAVLENVSGRDLSAWQ